MKCKAYNGEVRSSEKDFETLQSGAFATPGLLLAQGPVGLTAGIRIQQNECGTSAMLSCLVSRSRLPRERKRMCEFLASVNLSD
jgi:hypothetical protein